MKQGIGFSPVELSLSSFAPENLLYPQETVLTVPFHASPLILNVVLAQGLVSFPLSAQY